MFTKPHCAVYLFLALYYLACWAGLLPSGYEPVIAAYLALALAK